jgi:RimJ/RimL family protein N-acetyltransferase
VMSAFRRMFDECGYSKVSLTVADTHEKARALYERAVFRLLYTGVGQRKFW